MFDLDSRRTSWDNSALYGEKEMRGEAVFVIVLWLGLGLPGFGAEPTEGVVMDGSTIRFEREVVIEKVGNNVLNVVMLKNNEGCKEKTIHLGLTCLCADKEDAMCSITYEQGSNEARCGGETCCSWAVNAGPIIRPL